MGTRREEEQNEYIEHIAIARKGDSGMSLSDTEYLILGLPLAIFLVHPQSTNSINRDEITSSVINMDVQNQSVKNTGICSYAYNKTMLFYYKNI